MSKEIDIIVKFKVKDIEVELSMEDVKSLYEALKKIVGDGTTFVPVPYYVEKYRPWWPDPYRPWITWRNDQTTSSIPVSFSMEAKNG